MLVPAFWTKNGEKATQNRAGKGSKRVGHLSVLESQPRMVVSLAVANCDPP